MKDKSAFKPGGEFQKKKVCSTDLACLNSYPALSIESGNIFQVPLILRNSCHIFTNEGEQKVYPFESKSKV